MINIDIKAVLKERGWVAVGEKEINDIVVGCLSELALKWHAGYMPLHFDMFASVKWHYEKRSKRYMARKARHMGHQRPLVFTGAAERAAKAMGKIRVVKKTRVDLALPAMPTYWFYAFSRLKDGRQVRQPPKMAELGMLNEDERERFMRQAIEMATPKINALDADKLEFLGPTRSSGMRR